MAGGIDIAISGDKEGIRVSGLRELRKGLKDAGIGLQDLKAANLAAAEIAAGGARRLVPVRSRKLHDSIRPAGTARAGIVRVGKRTVPYAQAIQWGRQIWPSKRGPAPAPPRHKFRSFIKPSLFATAGAKETEPEWVAAYEKAVDALIDQIEGA